MPSANGSYRGTIQFGQFLSITIFGTLRDNFNGIIDNHFIIHGYR